MESPAPNTKALFENAKRFARRLLTIGKNRCALLMIEVQEERERLLHATVLALGVVAFGLLAGIALTAAIVVLLWSFSRLGALLLLTGLYGAMAVCFYWRLMRLLRHWQSLPATFDQLKKDHACLERNLT